MRNSPPTIDVKNGRLDIEFNFTGIAQEIAYNPYERLIDVDRYAYAFARAEPELGSAHINQEAINITDNEPYLATVRNGTAPNSINIGNDNCNVTLKAAEGLGVRAVNVDKAVISYDLEKFKQALPKAKEARASDLVKWEEQKKLRDEENTAIREEVRGLRSDSNLMNDTAIVKKFIDNQAQEIPGAKIVFHELYRGDADSRDYPTRPAIRIKVQQTESAFRKLENSLSAVFDDVEETAGEGRTSELEVRGAPSRLAQQLKDKKPELYDQLKEHVLANVR